MSSGEGDSPTEVTAKAEALAVETEAKADALADQTASTAEALAVETAAKALLLAEQLTETLEHISDRLESYAVYGQRSRKIIIALVVSFTLDVAITIVLAITAVTAHSVSATNSSLVAGLHTANLMSCHNGNNFRLAQTQIWKDFVALVTKPAPGEPAAQVTATDKLAAGFLADVEQVNRAINCTALYGK